MSLEGAKRVRLLLLGPLPAKSPSLVEPIGGARVTFTEAVRELGRRGFDLDVIDTARPRPNLPLWKILGYELLTFRAGGPDNPAEGPARRPGIPAHVGLFRAVGGVRHLGAVQGAAPPPGAAVLRGQPLLHLPSYGPARRWLLDRTCLRAPLVYEERRTLRAFSRRDNFRWLANTRDLVPAETGQDRDRVRRLIFKGQLRQEKGLAEALEACRSLPGDCHLRVFGPRMPNTDFSLFDSHPRASYGGVLTPEEVPRVLAEHDLLLFLSYMGSEGTPGVIIEAFQCGVPVVATAIGGIPEQVEHEKSGLLVAPRSVPELKAAIERLIDDPALYRRLCAGARAAGRVLPQRAPLRPVGRGAAGLGPQVSKGACSVASGLERARDAGQMAHPF